MVVVLSEFSQTSKIGRIFWNRREALRRLNLNKKTAKNLDFTRLLTGFKFLILDLDSAYVTMT
ncbi:hypothetical protein B1222_18975 [Paenibacillus larvae subsp. pulvifaciens]|nr:hypothetical protein B1222_18975 [Paenibacillus larvae subsp. pulvifaciens]AQZ45729.1 hypothetical protein B5S25_03040 [Paenibacillus larvae subsp. pulvifaciens]MBH0340791.1 hypothetical protein [Paenibacillus larvae]